MAVQLDKEVFNTRLKHFLDCWEVRNDLPTAERTPFLTWSPFDSALAKTTSSARFLT